MALSFVRALSIRRKGFIVLCFFFVLFISSPLSRVTSAQGSSLSAVFELPSHAFVGDAVKLNAINSQGPVELYIWNMGDGVFLQGFDLVYAYSQPGNYTVTLTVYDAAGNANSLSITISVTEIPTDYSDTILVVNTASQNSKQIAEYFKLKRNFPQSNICEIYALESENISRSGFNTAVKTPIEQFITNNNLESKINYIITTKGVPLAIWKTDPNATFGWNDEASVDSELALILGKGKDSIGNVGYYMNNYSTENSYFVSNHFSHQRYGTFIVTRLEGYSLNDVKSMIDRSTEMPPADSNFVFDVATNRGDTEYNNILMKETHNMLYSRNYSSVLDETATFLTNVNNVIGYYSWGSNESDCASRQLRDYGMGFVPRSIGEIFVSTSGRTFFEAPETWMVCGPTVWGYGISKTNQSLLGDLLKKGLCAGKGYVAEPYTFAVSNPMVVMDSYTNGLNMAESFYIGSQLLGWKDIVVGDPKMKYPSTKPYISLLSPVSGNYNVEGDTLSITGYAVGADFQGFKLEWAHDSAPNDWQTGGLSSVFNGTRAVNNNFLGIWDTKYLNKSGKYFLKLTGYYNSGVLSSTRELTINPTGDYLVESTHRINCSQSITGLDAKAVDYDSDGDVDIAILKTGGIVFLANDGTGNLTEKPEHAINLGDAPGKKLEFHDFDNDGDSDLFVINSGFHLLLVNDGKGTFSPADNGPNNLLFSYGEKSIVADFNKDKNLDICVLNDGQYSFFKGEGNLKFEESANAYGLIETALPVEGFYEDFNSDGLLDILILTETSANLYINDGTRFQKSNAIANTGIALNWKTAVAADFSNDGRVDILAVTSSGVKLLVNGSGMVFTAINIPDLAIDTTGKVKIAAADLNSDALIDIISTTENDLGVIYINKTDSTGYKFEDASLDMRFFYESAASSILIADFNMDGTPDLFMMKSESEDNRFYINRASQNAWMQVELQGTETNIEGIGSQIVIKSGDKYFQKTLTLNEGESIPVHFGLGSLKSVDSITILWASGKTDVFNTPGVCQKLEISENGTLKSFTRNQLMNISQSVSSSKINEIKITKKPRVLLTDPFPKKGPKPGFTKTEDSIKKNLKGDTSKAVKSSDILISANMTNKEVTME